MTKQLLDEADVGAILEHVSRTRVAEEMAGAPSRESRAHDVSANEVAQPILDERLAVVGEE